MRVALRLVPLLSLLSFGAAQARPDIVTAYDKTFTVGGGDDGGYAPVSLTVPVTVNAGDFIYLALGMTPSTTDILSVSDSAGNGYQQVFALENGLSGWRFGTGWTQAQSTTSLVITFLATHFDILDVHLLVYSGVDPLNPIDHSARGSELSLTEMSCDLTTTQDGDLLLAFMPSAGGFSTPGLGATVRSSLRGHLVQEMSVAAADTYHFTATTFAAPWLAQCVALRRAPLGDGGVTGADASVTDDAGVRGDGGGSGGSSTLDDGGATGNSEPLISNLGCSVTQGAMLPVGLLLVLALRVGTRRRG